MCFFSEAIMSVPASTGEGAWLLAPHCLPLGLHLTSFPDPTNVLGMRPEVYIVAES